MRPAGRGLDSTDLNLLPLLSRLDYCSSLHAGLPTKLSRLRIRLCSLDYWKHIKIRPHLQLYANCPQLPPFMQQIKYRLGPLPAGLPPEFLVKFCSSTLSIPSIQLNKVFSMFLLPIHQTDPCPL